MGSMADTDANVVTARRKNCRCSPSLQKEDASPTEVLHRGRIARRRAWWGAGPMLALVLLANYTEAELFRFMTRTNSSHAHESSSPHLEKKLQGHVAPNITIVRQTWYAKQQKRWDEKEGGTIDSMLKDDGPKQLQNAMLVLCIVAGTVICGGACGIVCLWSNRERGWSSAAKAKKRAQGGDYSQADTGQDQYQGAGAKWLNTPV